MLVLPLEGWQLVHDGHEFDAHHRRWDYTIPGLRALGYRSNFMRYAYDFVSTDRTGRMSNGPEARNESWIGFGRPVRAAGDGVVVAVVDSQPDDRKFDPGQIAQRGTMSLWGNHIVVDHGRNEFSLYAHLRRGSGRIRVGDRVRRGQRIAAVGASGSANFPHLHFELQSGASTDSEGVPAWFHAFDRIQGRRRVAVRDGAVETGELLHAP
ncbi:MAG: M23 family metallopeptidase [Gemmatimonadaceae bacterium]|nr:M23 family metallopeptidase [Gemmatimonadaceae bacterium]